MTDAANRVRRDSPSNSRRANAGKSATSRTMAVLEQVAGADHPPTHAELARLTGVPKSSLSTILSELQSLGYVRTVSERHFVPGPGLVGFSHRLQSRNGVGGVRPALEGLAAASHESAVFAIEVWPHMVAVEHVQAPRPVRYVAEVGVPKPLYCTALGRVLMAFTDKRAGDLPAGTLVKLTNLTAVDPVAIDAELALTRERGYALNIGESIDGVASIAAPVLNSEGWLLGALAVSWLLYRVDDGEHRFWPLLKAAVADLERSL